jgi:hypothetical protein
MSHIITREKQIRTFQATVLLVFGNLFPIKNGVLEPTV